MSDFETWEREIKAHEFLDECVRKLNAGIDPFLIDPTDEELVEYEKWVASGYTPNDENVEG